MSHTSAARAAVANLTKTLAVEWGSAGVSSFFKNIYIFGR